MKNPIYNHTHFVDHHKDGSTHLLAHSIIKMMGSSMISLFIPSFLYTYIGLDIWQIMLFMSIMSLSNLLIAVFVGGPLLQKYGPRIMMILGTFFFALYLLILYFSKTYYGLVFFAPFSAGAYTGLFWISFHYKNSIIRHNNNKNTSIYTKFAIYSNIGIALGPIIGGFLTVNYNILRTLGTAIILVLFSTIPLFFYKENYSIIADTNYSIKVFFSKLYDLVRENRTKIIYKTFAVVSYNNIIASIIWPLLIFLFVHDFQKIGIIGTITSVVTIVVLYLVNKLDENTSKGYLKALTLIQSSNRNLGAIATILGFLISPLIVVIDVIQKVLSNVNDNNIDKLFFVYADDDYKENKLYPILLREIGIHGARFFLLLFLALLYYYFSVTAFTLVLPMIITAILVKLSWSIIEVSEVS